MEKSGQLYRTELEPATAVNLFIGNGQDILLLWRSQDDTNRPGASDLPGGAVDPGEESVAAAVRETCEEVGPEIGLSLSGLRLVYSETTAKPKAGINLERLYYTAFTKSRRVCRSDEHRAELWTPRRSVYELLTHESQLRAWHSLRTPLASRQIDVCG